MEDEEEEDDDDAPVEEEEEEEEVEEDEGAVEDIAPAARPLSDEDPFPCPFPGPLMDFSQECRTASDENILRTTTITFSRLLVIKSITCQP